MADAAHQPRSHLRRLPNELLLQVVEQPCLSVRDIISLARTSCHYYGVVISAAYKKHIKEELGLAIYWAIEHGRYKTLERLLNNGVDVNMLDEQGELRNISDTLVDHELEYDWEDMEFPYAARFSPLALAAYYGMDSMVELLLENGAIIELQSTQLCECCNLLLRCAESLPDGPTFWEESDRQDGGGYLSWDEVVHDSWWTPLHYAICQGNVSTAKLLLERGADATDVGDEEVNALHVATRWNSQEMIDYLLEKNLVDINSQTERGVTALHVAHIGGNHELVDKFLKDHGADIDLGYTDDSGPWTIFAMACAEGDFDRALHYLRNDADPNFVIDGVSDRNAWTAMRYIYGNNCPATIRKNDVRIRLEKAIMEGGGEETKSDT